MTPILAALVIGSGLIGQLITLLIVALVLWLIYFLVGKFVSGTPLQIIGIILALILLLYALNLFGIVA